MSDSTVGNHIWKFSLLQIICFVFVLGILGYAYIDELSRIVTAWESPEYSHAYLIPFISLFIVWQNYEKIQQTEFKGAWSGVVVLLFGAFLMFAGELSTLYIIIQYAFLIVLCGLIISFTGVSRFYLFLVPVFLLFFTIPLPSFLYNGLSSYLQLISSSIGVAVIRLFGISVYLEGNVIDLGSYKLQVVEACNGLRYLFPLITLSVIASYFYNDKFWKKVIIVLSALPITVLMNSIRIGIIGVLVEYWGIAMAEGFLHDFEGWIIFMACFSILLLEMWLLANISSRRSLGDVLNVEIPSRKSSLKERAATTRNTPVTFFVSTFIVIALVSASYVLPNRAEIIPERSVFAGFPSEIAGWAGNKKTMELQFINALKFEDYLLSTYQKGSNNVELYVAYYDSQKKGESAHSPRSCLPGAGWRITRRDLAEITYQSPHSDLSKTITINRMLVARENDKFFMYYWFKQRERHLANEYLVKWFLFWDALTKNRTDGALVRVIVPINIDSSPEETEIVAKSFLQKMLPLLEEYVPD